MKPFDLELAKQGIPVQTRDGRPARIICYNKKGVFPIVALIDCGGEEVVCYSVDGKRNIPDDDLVMAPIKKEGWMNIYHRSMGMKGGCIIHESEEKAKKHITPGDSTYIATTKIEWEE